MKAKECKTPNCNKPYYAKGLCKNCYAHLRYLKNKEEILIKQKQYYLDNKDNFEFKIKRANYQKEYKSREEVKQKGKLYKREKRKSQEYRLQERKTAKRYRVQNREKIKSRDQKNRDLLLKQALSVYDYKCELCNNDDIVVLEFHHRDGSGKQDNYKQMLKRIISNKNKLDNIMLLCANCHIHQDLIDGTGQRGKVSNRIINLLKEE